MSLASVVIAGLLSVVMHEPAADTITGTASYQAGRALPVDAVFEETLEDVSRVDAAASIIATTRVPSPSPSPIRFTIAYDSSRITERGRYVVRARIRATDRLLFTSDTVTPAITSGHPTTVSMTLRQAPSNQSSGGAPPSRPDAGHGGLAGTAWNAVELYGTPVSVDAALADRRPHLVFDADGRLSGADGCNRLTGPYAVKSNGITFGQIAGTQMACPKTDEMAKRFRDAVKGTSHWSIVRERLEFYGATGKPLAVFERRPATPPGRAALLQGTTWQLVRFQGGDDRMLTPDDPAKYTVEFAAGGQIAARVDCNRGRGTWKMTSAGQLELGPLALTRAQCTEGSLHDQIAKQWTYVRSFVIKDGHLFLSLVADGGTYEFAPVGDKKQ